MLLLGCNAQTNKQSNTESNSASISSQTSLSSEQRPGPHSPDGSQISPGDSNNESSSNGYTSNNVSVTGISLNYDQATIYVGKSISLIAEIIPENASNQEVYWTSSDTSVATVGYGKVKGISEGSAVITVTTADGSFTATCNVSVITNTEDNAEYVPDTNDTSIYFITNETLSNGTYDSANDEYTFSINSNYKQIYVNAPDKTIIVELNGNTIQNNENSPIFVADCDTVEISAKKNTTNYIKDTRDSLVIDEDDQGKGAIYVSNGDLKLKGTGTLNIEAGYYNGIHGKDDVKIQKETLNITAVNHGVKGNDSVTISSGTINISCGGDGLHTENTDISSKGNQRGNVTISGGDVTINSWGDAVAAAYNAVVEQADTTVATSFTAKTNKYSSYSGEIADASENIFYIKMNSSAYSNNGYTYAANIDGNWYKASYVGTQSSGSQGGPGGGRPGGSSTYYIYQIEKPAGATSFTLYRFSGNNVTSFSTSSYNAVGDAKAFNNAYDMVQISVSSGKISFSSWSNYASGNSNGADVSAKGLKAENEVIITAGTIDIKAYDDAIHANNDGTLDNGSSPLGNVTISGGNITLYASDDAIHADYTLEISGGKTEVTSAYEGLEGNLIIVSGGETYVYATDDGVNATSGKSSPNITVSGGLLDVAVPTNGDTDGIDSNGSLTITGGTVIAKGPGSASGNAFGAAAVDTDGAVSITGGSLIIFGGIEKTPSGSPTKTLCLSSSVAAGTHTVSFASASYTTTLKSSSSGCVVFSHLGTATLS